MALTITQTDYSEVLGLSGRMASLRFSALPFSKRGRQNAYALADALPTLSRKYAHHAPALLARAVDDGDSFVGNDTESAKELERWLLEHVPEAAWRIHLCRNRFCKALASEMRSSAYLADIEALRLLILKDARILGYVLTGIGEPSDWGQFARRFSILHACGPVVRAA
jgi:hypothetical protein